MELSKSRPNAHDLFLSPYGLALFSYSAFVIAWLVPPGYYSEVLGEPNLLFFDPPSMLLYSLCFIAFVTGVAVIGMFFPASFVVPSPIQLRVRPSLFLLVPLVAGILMTLESILLLLRGNPYVIDLILAQQGIQVKENLGVHEPLGLASVWLLGICWWATWRRHQLNIQDRWERWLVIGTISAAMLCVVASTVLKLGRGEFMPVVIGTALLYLLRRSATQRLSRVFLVRFATFGAILTIALFLLFSFARGNEDILFSIMAYSVASYNHLAAIVSDRLRYPYAGHGVYLSSFLSFNTSLNNLIPISEIMHWPTFEDVWASEFTATWQAGLNGNIIWSGTFGYLFADFGWFAPLVVLVHGLLFGWCWRSAKLGHIAGVILYPWFGFCILFWFGTNFFFNTAMVVLMLCSFVLSGYEHLFLTKTASSIGRRH